MKTPSPNERVTVLVRDKNGRKRPMQLQRADLVRRAAAAQVAKRILELTHNHHVNEKGKRIELNPQWRDVFSDPSPDMVIVGPSQRGKSLYMLVKMFAQVSLGMSVGWIMSKQDQVRKFVAEKVDPTIKNTPVYRELLAQSGGSDGTFFKTMGEHGRIFFVTANSESEMTSFSADAMNGDEYDFCNRRNMAMAASRMNYSPYRLTHLTSTPTYPGATPRSGQMGSDNIVTRFLAGDQYRYHSICPRCQTKQILDWYENFVNCKTDESGRILDFNVLDQDWSPGQGEPSACCKKCKYPFDRTSPGVWISLNPGAPIRSRWVEALAEPVGPPMSELVSKFESALPNPWLMQQFHNMDLGRPYAGGAMRFTEELFDRCCDRSLSMMEHSDGPCTMGIDVNRPWLDVQITNRSGEDTPAKVWVGKMQADNDALIEMIRRFNVMAIVIDNMPETDFAIKLQKKVMAETPAIVVRCKYASDPNARPISVSEPGENPSFDPPRLITVNSTPAIDAFYALMRTRGIRWFRQWREAIDGMMIEEFTTPVRKTKLNDNGFERPLWEGKPDHQLHAAIYDELAGQMMAEHLSMDFSGIKPLIAKPGHVYDDDEGRNDPGGGFKPLILIG